MKIVPSFFTTPIGIAAGFVALCSAGISSTSIALTAVDFSHMAGRFPKPQEHATSVAGRLFPASFAPNEPISLSLDLDGRVQALTGSFGVADDTPQGEASEVWFEVYGDNKLLYTSEPMKRGEPAKDLNVPLAGVHSLVLAVQSSAGAHTFAALAGLGFTFDGAAPIAVDRAAEPEYILTPKPGPQPRINGASIVGARPGHPFLFKVPVTGSRPMSYSAANLPEGLSLDSATGIITGSVKTWGEYRVQLTAKNSAGEATRELRIVIGNTIALTPPMGWNSWNCFASAVKETDVEGAADAFVKTGLIDHGWTYVNVDDFWETRPLNGDPVIDDIVAHAKLKPKGRQYSFRNNPDPSLVGPARDAQGKINSNSRFPDMKAMADHIHSLGLKAGLYSSPGPLTCGGCTASYAHEQLDAERFAEWGFDYLKYDWCTYRHYFGADTRAERVKPYDLMGRMLLAQNRDIVFSLCQYGDSNVWEWGASVDGNCWRTTGDINDTWGSMAGIGFSQNGHEAYSNPGHWNDPDMLVVGLVGWGPKLHPTRLTPDEQYTHISLWSLLAAPMLIGCDLTKVDDFTLGLLTNDEVIAVDQDPLGHPARRVVKVKDSEVWARVLADGSMAVGLFNRSELPATVRVNWSDLGLTGDRVVRDLWRQSDIGTRSDGFEAKVPRHGVVLIKVSPPAEGNPSPMVSFHLAAPGQHALITDSASTPPRDRTVPTRS